MLSTPRTLSTFRERVSGIRYPIQDAEELLRAVEIELGRSTSAEEVLVAVNSMREICGVEIRGDTRDDVVMLACEITASSVADVQLQLVFAGYDVLGRLITRLPMIT